jgi:hypothetical protein
VTFEIPVGGIQRLPDAVEVGFAVDPLHAFGLLCASIDCEACQSGTGQDKNAGFG